MLCLKVMINIIVGTECAEAANEESLDILEAELDWIRLARVQVEGPDRKARQMLLKGIL